MAEAYVLKKSSDDQFYFYLRARNNEPILVSERYTMKGGAQNGIESCKENSPTTPGMRRGRLQGRAVLRPEGAQRRAHRAQRDVLSEAARDNGIEACKKYGPIAPTDDQT